MAFTEFQLLSTLAQEMNMRKAAERLFVSQPALSQRLHTIENEWGSKLFHRSQKGLSLTPAGEEVVRFASARARREDERKNQGNGASGLWYIEDCLCFHCRPELATQSVKEIH